jgi:hypothetical protein
MASDVQVQRMIDLGVPEAKAASAAVAASNSGGGEAFNKIVTQYGGTVTSSPANPTAGTVIGQTSTPNGNGTYTVTTTYADGNGGTYTRTSIVGTPITATGPTGPSSASAQQEIANKNALQLMQSTLAGYGIDPTGAISNAILGLTQSNYDAQTITALAQDPNASKSTDPNVVALANAWQTRFSGNTLREKAGLTPLDPASYIATENSYKAVMQQAGLPAAATDNALLGQLIGKDVSPAETQMRVNAAMSALQSEDPQVIAQLQSQYGLTQGALALHLLSPDIAANVIQQQVTAAQIGAEAARQGTNIQYGGTGPLSAMGLAAQGVTQAQAAQGFGTIAQQLPATQTLAARYNPYVAPEQVGQALEASTFGTQGAAEAAAALKRLQTQEVSTFSGSAGASTQAQSLGIANAQGTL